MKSIFKIATVTSCLASFCYGNVSAAEDAIMREQQEVSSRVARMSEQNWQAYTGAQETPRNQKQSKQAHNRKQGKAEENSHLRDIFGWYANRVNIKYTEAKQITQFQGGWLYAYIAPSLTNPQWENALDKGLATRAKGQNGIKVLDSVIELKINDGQRLYATTLHKNDQGDYIAILNGECGHKEIKRKANRGRFEVMDCASKPQQR